MNSPHCEAVSVTSPFAAGGTAGDEQLLLDQARAGDPEAFCELCRTQETRLLRQAMLLCGNEVLAEELAQDSLVEAWRSLHRYRGHCRFFTWLCAILHNRFRNMLRQRRPRSTPTEATGPGAQSSRLEHVPDTQAGPDEAAQLEEQAEWVRRCVQALPAKHQQVIYLRFYADDSLEGIAAALGCSIGTVKSRLFHALEKLRKMSAFGASHEHIEGRIGML